MDFANPLVLLGLLLPGLLLAQTWWRPTRRVVLPFDHGRLRSGRWTRVAIDLAQSTPSLLLAIAIVLLAGPRRAGEPRSVRELTNIQFVVDISGSMTAKFGEGSRYDAAMAAIDEFLDYRDGDAFGLTFYGNNYVHWVPLTNDTSAIKCAPKFLSPTSRIPGFGGTEIGKALLACKDVLVDREEGDRMIVLFSDGFSSDLGNNRDEEIAKELRDAGVTLFAVHIADGELPAPIVNLAVWTDGEWFQPGDPVALKRVFERIDGMTKAKLKQIGSENLDDFEPWCWAGLSVMGLLLLSAFGLRYTPW